MPCLVCGSANSPRRPRFRGEPPGFECAHCLARNAFGTDGRWRHEPYRVVSERWTAARRERGPASARRVEHALAERATLCGLFAGHVEAYRHFLVPSADSCARCAAVALEVDARWPSTDPDRFPSES